MAMKGKILRKDRF